MQTENNSLAEQRLKLQTKVFHDFVGREIKVAALETLVIINRKGLKHCISRRYPNTHQRTLALLELPALLTKSRYLGKEIDSHVPPRPGVFIHKFETEHELMGTPYSIWLYVRETPDLLNFYDLG